LENTREIEIATVGRTTGRQISQPVWFARRGDKFYLLPATGPDSNWYKNLQKGPGRENSAPRAAATARPAARRLTSHSNPTIRRAACKAEHNLSAAPITDPAEAEEVVEAFRAEYGAKEVKAYYPTTGVAVEVSAA